ncbi:MAG: hypothetical protein IIB58_08185 [Planctomycetes bacterium]|nr:hypothetical protein [Planctomycetota bacterium]
MRDWRLEADEVLEQAQRQASEVIAAARAEGELIQERARREGHQAGLEQGLAEGAQRGAEEAFTAAQAAFGKDLAHLADNLTAVVREVSDQRVDRLHAAEHDLLSFAIDIAGRVAKVIGEVNNGGDLVGLTIRTVRKSIPFKAIHASRGKYVRAEPVAALYEQGKVFHTQPFAELEDQMCTWLAESGESPDRMDALVFALTELMLTEEKLVRFG